MKEQLIELETARLAKEKGFDWASGQYYQEGVELLLHKKSKINNNDFDHLYEAPTQSLLQKWLREEKRIIVEPRVFDDWNVWGVTILGEDIMCPFYEIKPAFQDTEDSDPSFYDSYEQALEKGLQRALKEI